MTSFLSYIRSAESTYIASLTVSLFDYVDFRLLLHTETPDGSVIPVWEEVRPGNVAVMKDVMSACKSSYDDVDVFYRRVPITAERSPDFSDFSELIAVMLGRDMTHTPIVVNDQLGRGRSTLTSVSITWRKRCPHTHLRWLLLDYPYSVAAVARKSHAAKSSNQQAPSLNFCSSRCTIWRSSYSATIISCHKQYARYATLPSSVHFPPDLLRVIRKGPAVKDAVDDAIDQCAEVFNLRDSIEEARIRAEQVTAEREKRSFAQRGPFHPYLQIDNSLIASKAFKICGDTSSLSFSRLSCSPQSQIPCKRTKLLKRS
jgi:hypothetical protein